MIEIPIVILLLFFVLFLAGGFGVGASSSRWLTTERRKRALANATPMWEVRLESSGSDHGYGIVSAGDRAVVIVRKVRRTGDQVKVLQKIEVARVSPEESEKLLAAVERGNQMINTLMLTGVA